LTNINFGTLIPLLIGILAGGFGSILLVLAWRQKRKEDISKTWQPAPGTILTSEIREHNSVDPADPDRIVTTPIVRYQYTCAGKSFNGYRISFNSMEYSKAKAQQIVSRYAPGSSITVYFDPLHPEEAVLERNLRGVNLLFSTGLVLFALGMGACCISILVYWIVKLTG
jgi:hypothetical protein